MNIQVIKHLLVPTLLLWSMVVNAEKPALSDITVKTLNGHSITLDKLISNKPVYLKFWATWCQPCREQMPHLQQTFDQYGKKIDIISINLGINDSLEEIIKTKEEFKLTIPIYIDDTAKLAQAVNLIATPYHIVLDSQGHIVHKGHEASPELDNKLKKLAINNHLELPPTTANNIIKKTKQNDSLTSQSTLLFFTSAWCDWYLKTSRPQMSSNCVNAQKTVNDLYGRYPTMNWQGILTQLWTGQKELNEYKKKYNIQHPISIDQGNDLFLKYQVKQFPTLIAIKDDQEIFRLQDFSRPERSKKLLQQLE